MTVSYGNLPSDASSTGAARMPIQASISNKRVATNPGRECMRERDIRNTGMRQDWCVCLISLSGDVHQGQFFGESVLKYANLVADKPCLDFSTAGDCLARRDTHGWHGKCHFTRANRRRARRERLLRFYAFTAY